MKKGGEERREDMQPKPARPAGASVSPDGCAVKPGDHSLPTKERVQGESIQEKPQTAASQKPEEERKHAASKEVLVKETVSTSVLAPSKPKSPEAGEVVANVKSPVMAPETPEKKSPVNEEMEVSVEAHKRKSESREEALTTPEKKPRIMENCQHHQAFRTQPQSFPAAGTPVPRVPPLKVKRNEDRSTERPYMGQFSWWLSQKCFVSSSYVCKLCYLHILVMEIFDPKM